jgi:FO synthase
MLESSAKRLGTRGGPHHGRPDKDPQRRLAAIDAAGRVRVPLTTGILVGIGETRAERIEARLDIRDSHERHGHIQDLIIQNFRAKPGTRMSEVPDASLQEQLWTNEVARLLFGPDMSIQAPPNLRADDLSALAGSGINDWGGVSAVTPDHVNPERPWPDIDVLREATESTGRVLAERLVIMPAFARAAQDWVDAALVPRVLRQIDTQGLVRDSGWYAGLRADIPAESRAWTSRTSSGLPSRPLRRALRSVRTGEIGNNDIELLFAARGADLTAVVAEADLLRRDMVGDSVSYAVNRNINYTNVCTFRCGFCAFSKGRSAQSLRGPAYRLDISEIQRRAREAYERGATEVCLQGGIHPQYTGETYLQIVDAIKSELPSLHIRAFSPLEIKQGAATLRLDVATYLQRLKQAGLSSLPGTAAEILADRVRADLCPDKLTPDEWFEVIDAAHRAGLYTTATIMFGHIESYSDWALHLQRIRRQQMMTRGFTEFVPLPFVHLEAPLWRRGRARSGPTFREAILMHSVARLVLQPYVSHIQASWVKLGREGLSIALRAGADDMGGTLMDESITRAAGGAHGQQMTAEDFRALASSIGRGPWQRSTLYRTIDLPRVPPRVSTDGLECSHLSALNHGWRSLEAQASDRTIRPTATRANTEFTSTRGL